MAKTFLTNINLKGNQLLNAVIHSASSAPSALAAGQLYFNTGDNTFYYSTGAGTGSWQPVGVQYISSVGSNLSVTSGELDISTDPSFNTIHLTQDGQGQNILVGNDAYIGDINVSNFLGIKGYEDGTKGGIKFGSAKTETISSNGNDLTLESNNDIILLPGSDYAYIGSPAIDGHNRIATLGDINTDLTGYVTETGTQNLSNKTFLGTVYFQSAGGAGSTLNTISVDNSTGHMAVASGYELELTSANDINITSYSGDIVINPDGTAYIGSKNADNRIATVSDILNSQSNVEGYADNVASQAQATAESYAANVAAQAQSAAEGYADSLAGNYDPAGAASSAQSAAQSYADGKASQAQSAAESYADNVAAQAQSAAEGYTNTAVANLVGMAPDLLNTLEKIDNAIANDANFSTTLLNDIANAVSNAESYADGKASQAQSAAESYADGKASQAQSAAEGYADEIVGNLHFAGGKYVGTITGGVTSKPFTFTHNFGNNDVIVRVYQTSSGVDQYSDVEVDIKRSSDGNSVTVGFAVDPISGENYKVVIIG